MNTPLEKQFEGEPLPRSLYRAFRSGGRDCLQSYAFTVRQAFEQMQVGHSVLFEDETMICSESGGQRFFIVKVKP